jgi:hypothetical protein
VVNFTKAAFSGAEVSFTRAAFSGGMVGFFGAKRWSHPPVFSWDGKPPTGVQLPAQPDEGRKGEL